VFGWRPRLDGVTSILHSFSGLDNPSCFFWFVGWVEFFFYLLGWMSVGSGDQISCLVGWIWMYKIHAYHQTDPSAGGRQMSN
jgi:hypothetical protein